MSGARQVQGVALSQHVVLHVPFAGEPQQALLTCARQGPSALRAHAPSSRCFQRVFGKYARSTGALLMLARRPWLRRPVVRLLGKTPWLFERILHGLVT
ncbi:hypothetical protein [Myxococcus sp. NMCA1]|uniref:hypothetical protein n=1 Tax=Myxococcus sp. NMCA1 TaxID=2996785 RepID=UPI002286600A|nr:hypothetical protein [Myxococcus sp. NMCA1]WAM30469.1 hypothetical protein OZ403_28485 [Myxococcus sp. NMCA1]